MEPSIDQKVKYLTRRKEEISFLFDYYKESNFEAIGFIAHKIKGNGSTFGYPNLSNIAMDIEAAIAESNFLKLEALINQLNIFVSSELIRLRP